MGLDYAEKEREFVEALGLDTGRNLAQWMQAIDAAGHGHRNDIIDWLRQQGFAFPKASWIERIHHNGGQLIYGDNPPAAEADAAARPPAKVREAAQPASAPPPQQLERRQPAAGLSPVLALGKGLRPLAELVLREIEAAVPGTIFRIAGQTIAIEAPNAYAALQPAPKEIRLYADFGASADGRVKRAETTPARGEPPFRDVVTINDARQIDAAFRDLVASAYMRALK